MNKDLKFPLNIQLFGEEDPKPEEPKSESGEPKTFTQEQVDKIVADRLAREKKSTPEPTPPAKDETPTAVEETPAVDTALVQKYVQAELKSAMMLEGIDPTKVARAVRLLDADTVLDEAGEVDSEKVATQIADLIKEWPELKAQGAQGNPGFKVGSDGGSDGPNEDAIAKAFGNI